tara:strand:- start:1239 stop:1589 length:351 start_codon:yes stop_codon:yes gene_type:complete
MKKAILAIAMLFSVVMYGQKDITGLWEQDKGSSYYTVILNNNKAGYIFTNFSFEFQNTIIETFIEKTDTHVKTVVHNPKNGWRVFCTYTYIDDNTLLVTYQGDYNAEHKFYRKTIN